VGPLLALGLAFLAMSWAGALFAGVDVISEPARLERGYPYAVTLLFILLAHQIGPFLLGRHRGVETSLPWLVPAPPPLLSTGIFGIFSRAEGEVNDRRALFDLAFAGSWLGGAAAIAALAFGLLLSEVHPLTADDPGGLMLGDSLLTNLVVRAVLGVEPAAVSIVLHPIALAGWVGMMLCGLSLLPIGQLNGGHIAYAVGGDHLHRWLTRGTLTALLVLGIGGWHGWMAWCGFMLLIDVRHPPPRQVDAPLDRRRLALVALSALLLIGLFLPEPVYRQPPPIEIPMRDLRAV
jgi:membrane-associated protease RseP (regulator of RpoE activity)